MPDVIVEVLLEKVKIDGAQAVTLDAIRRLITQVLSSDGGPIFEIQKGMQSIDARLSALGTRGRLEDNENAPSLTTPVAASLHAWPGVDERLHRVPSGFKWPIGKNTRIMWDYWWVYMYIYIYI